MKQSSTFALCLRCVPEQQFLPEGEAPTPTPTATPSPSVSPTPTPESHAKAASDSAASPNAVVSDLISSFPRRSLGENG